MSRHHRLNLFIATAVLAALACEQKPVDLSETAEALEWREFATFLNSASVSAIWGSGPNDVYVGYARAETPLRHFDGQAWEWVQPGNATQVRDIWGSGPNNIYVTTEANVMRFDGATWSDVGVSGNRVTGTDPQDVYVIESSAIIRFNGAEWDTIRTSIGYNGNFGVAAAFPGNVLIVSMWMYSGPDSLFRWNGSNWTSEVAPGDIVSFWGTNADDVFAAGREGTSYTGAIWRWQGLQWDPMALPATISTVNDLAGVSSNEVYATTCCDSLLLTFDGGAWRSEYIAGYSGFYEVWASGPTDIYLVPNNGLVHGDGTGWTNPFPIEPRGVEAIWAESPQRVVIVGDDGPGIIVFRYDHGVWTEERVDLLGSETIAIEGRSWNDLYIADDHLGVIHYDGTQWQQVLAQDVNDLAVAPDGTVFVAGYEGLDRFDGTSWEHWDTPSSDYLSWFNAVWAASSEYAALIGNEGLWRFNGDSFLLIRKLGYPFYDDVWGVSPREIYFAGDALLKYDGSSTEKFGPPVIFHSISGTGADHILAIGQSEFFKNGEHWQASPVREYYIDFAPTSDGSFVRMTRDASVTFYSPDRIHLSYHRP